LLSRRLNRYRKSFSCIEQPTLSKSSTSCSGFFEVKASIRTVLQYAVENKDFWLTVRSLNSGAAKLLKEAEIDFTQN
jgi:hypothetical protein